MIIVPALALWCIWHTLRKALESAQTDADIKSARERFVGSVEYIGYFQAVVLSLFLLWFWYY